jgi:hypothetical protein
MKLLREDNPDLTEAEVTEKAQHFKVRTQGLNFGMRYQYLSKYICELVLLVPRLLEGTIVRLA